MKPPISLLDYFATDLALTTSRTFDASKPVQFKEEEYLIEVAVQRNEKAAEKDRRWQVTLEVRHQPGPETNFPYSFRVVLVGQFIVAQWNENDEERMVRIQGASVLYGMTREIVRVLTGRGPYRPVILPTVSFYEQKQKGDADATGRVGASPAPGNDPVPPSGSSQKSRRKTAKKTTGLP